MAGRKSFVGDVSGIGDLNLIKLEIKHLMIKHMIILNKRTDLKIFMNTYTKECHNHNYLVSFQDIHHFSGCLPFFQDYHPHFMIFRLFRISPSFHDFHLMFRIFTISTGFSVFSGFSPSFQDFHHLFRMFITF